MNLNFQIPTLLSRLPLATLPVCTNRLIAHMARAMRRSRPTRSRGSAFLASFLAAFTRRFGCCGRGRTRGRCCRSRGSCGSRAGNSDCLAVEDFLKGNELAFLFVL